MGPPCAHQETMHIHHCALIRYELGKAQGAWEQQPAGWEALPFLHNCELSFLLILKYHIFERKISKNQICLYFTIWLEAGVSRIGSVNPISIKNRSLKEVARFFSTYYTHTHTHFTTYALVVGWCKNYCVFCNYNGKIHKYICISLIL